MKHSTFPISIEYCFFPTKKLISILLLDKSITNNMGILVNGQVETIFPFDFALFHAVAYWLMRLNYVELLLKKWISVNVIRFYLQDFEHRQWSSRFSFIESNHDVRPLLKLNIWLELGKAFHLTKRIFSFPPLPSEGHGSITLDLSNPILLLNVLTDDSLGDWKSSSVSLISLAVYIN